MKRTIRETTAILEVVFTYEQNELYVHSLSVMSARSIGAGVKQAVQQFQRVCPSVALSDGVTITFRDASVKTGKQSANG